MPPLCGTRYSYKDTVFSVFASRDIRSFFNNYTRQSEEKSYIVPHSRGMYPVQHTHKINEFASKNGIKLTNISTISKHPVPLWKRRNVIEDLIRVFGSYEVVVTDRLHGMIFSVIAGTYCIAIDNKTHKVKGVYDRWLAKYNLVQLMNNENSDYIFNHIESILREIKSQDRCQLERDMKDRFREMSDKINYEE